MQAAKIIFVFEDQIQVDIFPTDASARRYAKQAKFDTAWRVHKGELIKIYPLENK